MTSGSFLIMAAAALAALALIASAGWARGRSAWERYFRLAYIGMTVALAGAALLLLRAILTHDFRYDYVIGYTSRDLPGLYLFSAFWGGQEGTYLLWALIAAVMGFGLFRKGSWRPAPVLFGYMITIGILIMFMLDPGGNPFRLAARVPPDGRGLNPLLQDPWMAAHPPIVFIGYAAMTIPAVLAWVAAWRREDKEWVLPALRWGLVGFITLGAGIILGAVWAYKVLGWGGFWGWDPVENASLIPWLVSAALVHGLLVQLSTSGLRRTNLVLAMAGYFLVLYATFLTRSGVLADFSVHSFPKGTIYGLLVAALVVVAGISLFTQARRRVAAGPPMEGRLAWPLVLTSTIVLLSLSALLVLIGTSWPLLSSLAGKPATPTGPFYNQVNLPIYIILLAALGLGPFLSWVPLPVSVWARRFVPSLAFAVIGTIAAALLGGHGFESLALFLVALLALGSNLIRLVDVARRRPLHTGAALAHIGFALIFVGIVAAESWDRTEHLRLPLGQPVAALGRVLTYEGHVDGSEPKHEWRISVAKADASGRPEGSPRPADLTMYMQQEEQLYRKPAIHRGLASDFYIAPTELEQHKHEPAAAAGSMLKLMKNQPLSHGGATLTFARFQMEGAMGSGMVVNAIVEISKDGRSESVTLPLRAGDEGMEGTPVTIGLLDGARFTFRRMSVEEGSIQIEVTDPASGASGHDAEPDGHPEETLIVDASVKPLIGLLWLGTIFLGLGTTLALVRRATERRIVEKVKRPAAMGSPARGETRPARTEGR